MADNAVATGLEYKAENDVVVSIRNVSLTYAGEKGDFVALQNVNLDIHKGEFICVMGPSGCGKSTLLNIIAGFHQPTEGTAIMGNEPITKPDLHRGVMLQTPTLYPWIDLYENVASGGRVTNALKNVAAQEVDMYLDMVGLKDFKNQKPYELSYDMRQRVSLARVLANHPDIILMDEPFVDLDAITRDNMHMLMRQIWQKTGKPIFLITQDVDEALSLATRIIVMSDTPSHIVKEFCTDFTYDIGVRNRKQVRCSKEYMETREEILSIINSNDI